MSEHSFLEPRRQEALGVIILFGENLRKMFRVVAALLFASIYSDIFYFGVKTTVGILALLMAVYTVFQYLRFRFHVEEDELRVEKGVFSRERLSIPLDRIQTVHLSQNLIQQIFQLTAVKIDTAGSGNEELKISALSRADAQALQKTLSRKEAVGISAADQNERATVQVSKELVHLDLTKLMVVGLTQNHIRSGFIALGLVWGYYWQFEDIIRERLGLQLDLDPDQIEEAMSVAEWGIRMFFIFVMIFLVSSVLISMVRTILKHFNLKAKIKDDHIEVSAGLLKRNSYSIPLNKIQMMKWQGNPLRRIPGFETVMIRQSRSTGDDDKLSVEIPAVYQEQTERLEEQLFSSEGQQRFESYAPHPYYRILLTAIYGVLGLVPIIGLVLQSNNHRAWIVYAVYLVAMFFWVKKYVASIQLSTDGEVIRFSRGWLFTDRTLLNVYKIQSLTYRQSIFQKRRGTAHLKLYTAGGSLKMPFMPEALVKELYNYLLYCVEESEKSWM